MKTEQWIAPESFGTTEQHLVGSHNEMLPWTWDNIKAGRDIVAEPFVRGVRARLIKNGDAVDIVSDQELPLGLDDVKDELRKGTGDFVIDAVLEPRAGGTVANAFDILYHGQRDLRSLTLKQRRHTLLDAVAPMPRQNVNVLFWRSIDKLSKLQRLGYENPAGIVLKLADQTGAPWVQWERVRKVTVSRLEKSEEPMLQQVTGIVMEPDEFDAHNDIASKADIRKACHQFAADYRGGLTKLRLGHAADLEDARAVMVENYISPLDLEMGGQKVKKGTWLQTWQVKDPTVWGKILSGELTGFSICGVGKRLPVSA